MDLLKVEAILDFFDGPLVFEAADPIGGHYIGSAIPDEYQGRFLLVGIRPKDLKDYRRGRIDLLQVIESRPNEWRFCEFTDGSFSAIEVHAPEDSSIPADCLPDPGYVLHEDALSVDWLIDKATESANLVLSLKINPPESLSDTVRIHAEGLGKLLLAFQRLFKHTYNRWARDARRLQVYQGFQMDVTALHPGSLNVLMEPAKRENLFGTFEGVRALEMIGELVGNASEPAQVAGRVASYSGHMATAFRDFLDVLIEQDSGVEVAWADPAVRTATAHRMTAEQAKDVRSRLGMSNEVSEETVEFIGSLDEVDMSNRSWRLITREGRVSGKTEEGGPTLRGLTTGDVIYKFRCVERLEVNGVGSERSVYWMTSFEPLGAATPTTTDAGESSP